MIKHSTKSELVFEELRDMIYSGVLKPGEKVSAMEMAARMGVSRTPVNEAVKRLSDRKLVSILPNVGFEITILSLEDILDLQYLKITFEETAIKWIRDRNLIIDIGNLKELNGKIHEAVRMEDRPAYNDSVRKYHLEFIRAVKSKPLFDAFIGSWEYSGWEDTRFQAISRDLTGQCVEHVEQLDCIEKGDFDGALEIADIHGKKWIELFRRNFEGS